MYAALHHEQLVLASTEAQIVRATRAKYRCPQCRRRVILVIAQDKTPYFQHLNFTGSGGEKQEHLLGKCELKAALTAAGWQARLEVPLADGQIRADVLASPNLAFEIQCAPLSAAEFAKRHGCYQDERITDVWLVGRRHFLRAKIKKTQVIYLRFNCRWHWYYLEIDVARHQLHLHYNLQQTAWRHCLYRQSRDFALDELGLQALWNFHPHLQVYQQSAEAERVYLQKQLQQKTKLGLAIGQRLYEQHQLLTNVPAAALLCWQVPGADYNFSLLDL
ncbi:MAG: competence protein [Lactobacillus sp.]|jgi:competence protein CoiA|nr:competence protein [Lactobacillus sp.]